MMYGKVYAVWLYGWLYGRMVVWSDALSTYCLHSNELLAV